ncbi:MAG: SDR family oxidoreductase [Nitriliruptorales bacterium]|nr:SDR family oxidoreductase [Nitriliruptorales bacterium]
MAFRGKVALVTGGGSGMGQRLSQRLAEQGVKVAAVDLNEEGCAETANYSDNITSFTCDVTDADALRTIVDKVESDLGPIDRFAAAAGIMPSGPVLEMAPETIFKVMDVNFRGVVNTVSAILPGMIERRFGDAIIFSSLMGHTPAMFLGAYCASKHAVKSYAEILYHENRDSGVRFACVCPPAVKTPLVNQLGPEVKSLDALPDRFNLTSDQVIDAIESGLDKGKFWIMPGIAAASAKAYAMSNSFHWRNLHKIEGR